MRADVLANELVSQVATAVLITPRNRHQQQLSFGTPVSSCCYCSPGHNRAKAHDAEQESVLLFLGVLLYLLDEALELALMQERIQAILRAASISRWTLDPCMQTLEKCRHCRSVRH